MYGALIMEGYKLKLDFFKMQIARDGAWADIRKGKSFLRTLLNDFEKLQGQSNSLQVKTTS